MKQASLTIRTPADLAVLLDNRWQCDCIRVQVPGMPENQRLHWQAHLWQRYSACGCELGRVWGVLGAGAGGLYAARVPANSGAVLHAAAALLLFAAIGALGGAAGSVRARLRLHSAVQALRDVLDAGSTGTVAALDVKSQRAPCTASRTA